VRIALLWLVPVLVLPLAAGCFNVDYGEVAFAWGPGDSCPAGYQCREDGRCHRIGSGGGGRIDGGGLDSGTPDAGLTDGGLTDGGGNPDAGEPTDAAPPHEYDTCATAAPLIEDVVTAGSSAGASSEYDLTCSASSGGDVVHQFSLAADQAVLVSVQPTAPADWPLVASLRDADSCEIDDPDLSCVSSSPGPRLINRPSLPAGDYSVVLDNADSGGGDYEIRYQLRPPDATFGYWPIHTTGHTYMGLADATPVPAPALADESVHLLTVGFQFPFFGASYDTVRISANGYLSFDTVTEVPVAERYNNDCPLDASLPDHLVAVFWEDLVPVGGLEPSSLHYRRGGAAPNRTLAVEWVGFDIYESSPCQGGCNQLGARVTHTVVLHENGDIEFRYGPRQAPTSSRQCGQQHLGCSTTIGLRSTAGAFDADPFSCNTSSIDAGHAVYWVHPR
jgi:hypothetical protein